MKKIKDYSVVDGHQISLFVKDKIFYIGEPNEQSIGLTNHLATVHSEEEADKWMEKHKGISYSNMIIESLGFSV